VGNVLFVAMNRDLVTALQIFFIYRSAKMCAASAVGIQHSETAANLFHVRSQSSGKTESVRLESVEPVLETDSALRFRYEVFKMLKSEGKINNVFIENMMNWRHRGFNVYYGNAIWFHNEEGLENLARYIIRASFSAKASLRASRADDIYSGK
jgi:hypothetical protein